MEARNRNNAGLVRVLIARVPAEGIESFREYESGVLPLLAAHGGSLQRRLRSADARTEVHLVWFPSDEAFLAYRSDPRRATFQPLLTASNASLELLELEDVFPAVS